MERTEQQNESDRGEEEGELFLHRPGNRRVLRSRCLTDRTFRKNVISRDLQSEAIRTAESFQFLLFECFIVVGAVYRSRALFDYLHCTPDTHTHTCTRVKRRPFIGDNRIYQGGSRTD